MDFWKERFDTIVHEINGYLPPAVEQEMLLKGLINSQLMDAIFDLYNQISSRGIQPDTMLMSKETYELVFGELWNEDE